ncbi:hypothetical protein PFISCL1PPCAC_24684, partial [Pristionchus fissidentatus]
QFLPLNISTVPSGHSPAQTGAVPYHPQCSAKSARITSFSQPVGLFSFKTTTAEFSSVLLPLHYGNFSRSLRACRIT